VFPRFFFEDPVWLGAGLLFIQLILILRWAGRRDASSRYALRAGLAMSALLMGISVVVITPREEIIAACLDLARAVDDGDVSAIAANLADDFEAGALDRAEFLARLEGTLSRTRVDRPRLRRFEVTFADPYHACVVLNATAQMRASNGFAGRLPTRWRLTFHRAATDWKLDAAESLPIPPLNLREFATWLH